PVVVLLHGSEDFSANDFNQLQRLLPAEGVGAFVFDKRGTGKSGGSYTQDFSTLADDAVAAMTEARRMAGKRAGRVGYYGPSQGGWVAPLAANRSKVDFVIVGFGLAVSPLEENRQEIRLEMTQKGYGAAEIAKAMEVAKAGEAIVTSNLKDGFDEFDAVRAKYRNEPWYKDLHGNYTYMLLPLDKPTIQASAERFVLGTPWKYDPMPALRASKTPQVWILGEDDLKAPSADTGAKIAELGKAGKPFTLAMFPQTMHGIYEYETTASGEQVSTRNADGFFAMLRDYALNGELSGSYGAAKITPPKGKKR
ncbi:MAG TPA: alpha/beta hydrolase, partial [Hyphomonadaceae bacterium]|nr:alpha/beta hydrolase [Hyphomonadaceae bacterium]